MKETPESILPVNKEQSDSLNSLFNKMDMKSNNISIFFQCHYLLINFSIKFDYFTWVNTSIEMAGSLK